MILLTFLMNFFFLIGRVTTTSAPIIETVFVEAASAQNGTLRRTREHIRRSIASHSTVSTHSSSTTIVAGHSVTRSSTSTSTTTESTSQIELRRNAVQADHNYGEPGPLSLRHSRRNQQHHQLSRHQRNPDELDRPNETVDDPLRISENISGRLRRSPRAANSSTVQNAASESDDDTPLHLLSDTPNPRNHRTSERHAPRYMADDSQPGPSSAASISSTRSSRTQKRPYYNEDSEEDDTNNRKRRATQSTAAGR